MPIVFVAAQTFSFCVCVVQVTYAEAIPLVMFSLNLCYKGEREPY